MRIHYSNTANRYVRACLLYAVHNQTGSPNGTATCLIKHGSSNRWAGEFVHNLRFAASTFVPPQ